MNKANLDFRATRDIDMILLIENRFEEFGDILWKFIKAGAYKCGWKSSEKLYLRINMKNIGLDMELNVALYTLESIYLL